MRGSNPAPFMDDDMARKPNILHIKLRDLWGSIVHCGPVTVQFQEKTRKHGKRAKIISYGRRPRHKRLTPRGENR